MSFELEMPESTDTGGTRLEKIGWYHVMVMGVDEQPTNARGELIDGFQVHLAVLDGDNADQKKKELHQTFFNAKLSSKDGGEFARKKQARLCLAVDIMPKGPHKPGDRVTIDLQDAVGRQLVVKTQWQKDIQTKQDTDYPEIAFAEIYHVDDPAVAKVAKDKAILETIPREMRKNASDFESSRPAKPGGGNGGGKSSEDAKRKAEALLSNGGGGSAVDASIDDL